MARRCQKSVILGFLVSRCFYVGQDCVCQMSGSVLASCTQTNKRHAALMSEWKIGFIDRESACLPKHDHKLSPGFHNTLKLLGSVCMFIFLFSEMYEAMWGEMYTNRSGSIQWVTRLSLYLSQHTVRHIWKFCGSHFLPNHFLWVYNSLHSILPLKRYKAKLLHVYFKICVCFVKIITDVRRGLPYKHNR